MPLEIYQFLSFNYNIVRCLKILIIDNGNESWKTRKTDKKVRGILRSDTSMEVEGTFKVMETMRTI